MALLYESFTDTDTAEAGSGMDTDASYESTSEALALDFDRLRLLTPEQQAFVHRLYRVYAAQSNPYHSIAGANLEAYGVLTSAGNIERRRKLALLQ